VAKKPKIACWAATPCAALFADAGHRNGFQSRRACREQDDQDECSSRKPSLQYSQQCRRQQGLTCDHPDTPGRGRAGNGADDADGADDAIMRRGRGMLKLLGEIRLIRQLR
jgi:hypothetical protein